MDGLLKMYYSNFYNNSCMIMYSHVYLCKYVKEFFFIVLYIWVRIFATYNNDVKVEKL